MVTDGREQGLLPDLLPILACLLSFGETPFGYVSRVVRMEDAIWLSYVTPTNIVTLPSKMPAAQFSADMALRAIELHINVWVPKQYLFFTRVFSEADTARRS